MTSAPDIDALVARLRAAYTAWNNPPSDGLPEAAGVVLEAASALTALQSDLKAARAERDLAQAVISEWAFTKERAEAAEASLAQARERIAELEAAGYGKPVIRKVERAPLVIEPSHTSYVVPCSTTIRICPMRDGPCPHGMSCKFVGDGYHGYPCKDGWSTPRALTTHRGSE